MSRLIPVFWCILVLEGVAAAAIQYPWIVADSKAYLALATNLSGQGFGIGSGADFTLNGIRPPGYPWFLNLLHVRMGLPIWSIIALQLGFYLATLWLIACKLIDKLSHRVAFLGIAIVYFFPFFYVTMVLSEALATLIVGALVVILSRARSTVTPWVIAGLLIGVGGLVRTDILPIGAALIVIAFIRLKPRTAATISAAAMTTTFAVLLPYMVWNQANFGQFTPKPAAATVGQSLWLASWESRLSHDDMITIYGGEPTKAAIESGYLREYHDTTLRAGEGGDLALSREFEKVAWARMRADPLNAAMHSLNGTWRLFTTSEYPLPWPLTIPLHILSIGTLALAAWGAARGTSTRVPIIVLLAVLIPHLPLHTEARYTAPLRPILLFYASAVVAMSVNRFGPRSWRFE